MKKKEADFSVYLRHYLKSYPLPYSCPIEVKDSRGKDYISFSEVKEEQINNALASKSSKGNLIRISNGTVGAPDYAYYVNAPIAPIFINFPQLFCAVDINKFVNEKDKTNRKSLTQERAKEISTLFIIK
jgi:hypothetical protein